MKAPDPQRYEKFKARLDWWFILSRYVSILIVILGTLHIAKALGEGRLEVIRLTKENQQLREKCH